MTRIELNNFINEIKSIIPEHIRFELDKLNKQFNIKLHEVEPGIYPDQILYKHLAKEAHTKPNQYKETILSNFKECKYEDNPILYMKYINKFYSTEYNYLLNIKPQIINIVSLERIVFHFNSQHQLSISKDELLRTKDNELEDYILDELFKTELRLRFENEPMKGKKRIFKNNE